MAEGVSCNKKMFVLECFRQILHGVYEQVAGCDRVAKMGVVKLDTASMAEYDACLLYCARVSLQGSEGWPTWAP